MNMNALVGYTSSEEEDNGPEDIQPEPPAKIENSVHTANANSQEAAPSPSISEDVPPIATTRAPSDSTAPAPGPAPWSPSTHQRQRLRELTMPTTPNFNIPDSPPPPERNSDEAAALAMTTKKFERFLDMKKQAVHFNARLQSSVGLRNPSLLGKLMDFADISLEEGYVSSLPEGLGVATKWPEECYVEGLIKQNERREKERLQERDRVDFVPTKSSKSAGSSASGTPKADGRRNKSDGK